MKFCSSCGANVVKKTPAGDNRERWVCPQCEIVHYVNPKIVVGCLPERDGKILLCKRAIEPRYGFWTAPAGFMELGESIAAGAARETLEEACATVRMGPLFAAVDVVYSGQLHLFFRAELISDFSAGEESLDVALYEPNEIPWDELAFSSNRFALEKWVEHDGGKCSVHELVINEKRPGTTV